MPMRLARLEQPEFAGVDMMIASASSSTIERATFQIAHSIAADIL